MAGEHKTISAASAPLLGRKGLTFRIGPFATRLCLSQSRVRQDFLSAYEGYPLSPPNRITDFHLVAGPTSLARRWIRPNTVAGAGMVNAPFVPLPRDIGLLAVETGMNWLVGSFADAHLTFHAGIVAQNGRAVIMPGTSGIGKSTLSAGLAFSGWQLLSDEFALYRTETGHFEPYPRPISLKNQSVDVMRAFAPDGRFSRPFLDTPKGTISYLQPPADAIASMDRPAAPRLILFPEYRPAERPRIVELRKPEAFAMVRSAAVNCDRLGATAFTAIARLLQQCGSFRLVYRSLEQGIRMVNDLMEERG